VLASKRLIVNAIVSREQPVLLVGDSATFVSVSSSAIEAALRWRILPSASAVNVMQHSALPAYWRNKVSVSWCHDQWRNLRGTGMWTDPPGKLDVKTGRPFRLYFGFSFFFAFQQVVFLRFSECFPLISGFSVNIHIRIHHHFTIFFWVLASEPPSAKFPPWLKPLLAPQVMTFCFFSAVKQLAVNCWKFGRWCSVVKENF